MDCDRWDATAHKYTYCYNINSADHASATNRSTCHESNIKGETTKPHHA